MAIGEKELHNWKHDICEKELAIRSIILLHDIRCRKNMSRKLFFKALEFYQICNAVEDKEMYILEELNELRLAGSFAGDKLKKLHSCQQFWV